MRKLILASLILVVMGLLSPLLSAATWQYQIPWERGLDKAGKPLPSGAAYLWLPPASRQLRGVLLMGKLGIELEIALSPEVRQACTDSDVGILYITPHPDGVFHFWQKPESGQRLLAILDAVAQQSGRPEIKRVPWITAGHSTAGIYCRNVAYWMPQRVAGVLHIKSGNFHQADHLPPTGSLVGVPLLAINGQLESFGPGKIEQPDEVNKGWDKRFGRETQWNYCLWDLQKFRKQDANYLLGLAVHPGEDHFHGGPELSNLAAIFIRQTALHRLPKQLPAGDAPVAVLPLKAEDGWLSDPDLRHPHFPFARYAQYAGDRTEALWYYDQIMADAVATFQRNLGDHQVLAGPEITWLDDGDGWTFKASSAFLDTWPEKFRGPLVGQAVGHSTTPFIYRCKIEQPVVPIGPDTFRVLRPIKSVNIAAYHPGDLQFRATCRWGDSVVPIATKGQTQTIDFPPIAEVKSDSPGLLLTAKASSGLPVYYEVDYGPVTVSDGKLIPSEVPAVGQFPIACKVTAYQLGRRTGEPILPAAPVSQSFTLVR